MSNFIKTSVRTLKELPVEDVRDLFTWLGTTNIQADNPNLLVAKASDENGKAVAYLTAENILLVDGYAINPESAPGEAGRAGEYLDRALASRAGVSRMWVVIPHEVPHQAGERQIRVLERKILTAMAHEVGYSSRVVLFN